MHISNLKKKSLNNYFSFFKLNSVTFSILPEMLDHKLHKNIPLYIIYMKEIDQKIFKNTLIKHSYLVLLILFEIKPSGPDSLFSDYHEIRMYSD